MEGHPMILGRPWLAIVDAYMSCQKGEMTISNDLSTKKLLCIHMLNLHQVILYG